MAFPIHCVRPSLHNDFKLEAHQPPNSSHISSSIAVPIAVYYVAVDRLPETSAEKAGGYQWWRSGFDRIWRARLISFASWIALAILFYVPILLLKHAGRSSINKMLKKWENEDQAARPTNSEIPHWHLGYIGIFGSTVVSFPSNF